MTIRLGQWLVIGVSFVAAGAGSAAETASTGAAGPGPADASPRLATVVAGPEYARGGFVSFWLGKGYRDLWTTPVTVPVLDLGTFAGGLRPVRRVGRLQTAGLAFEGEDGRRYTFRSLDKEPERVLPVEWRHSFPGWIVRDHTSAIHPGAALLLPRLAEALSILHTEPRLVVLPDSTALGEFRKDFGDRLGTLDVYPSGDPEAPRFDSVVEIVETPGMWKRWREGPQDAVDPRAFLRARVLDLFVGNYDRHAGQWRWARVGGQTLWQPFPEDPDMAFVRNEGVVFDALRGRAPKFVKFGPDFPRRLEGMTLYGSELDRWLLAGLDRAAFEEVAREAQASLGDAVIDEAILRLPPEWRPASQARLKPALQTRRGALVGHVLHFYRDLAKQVDVQATDRDELVTLRRLASDALEVTVASAGAAGPWFRRTFVPGETREVRLHLHGGNDRVERSGERGGPIRVRVVAGEGRDVVDDARSGGTEVWPGTGELEVLPGPGTRSRGPWTNPEPDADRPWTEPRDFGQWTTAYTEVMYATELDLLLGFGVRRRTWGFRSTPEASLQDGSFLWSTGESRGRFAYEGTFRRPGSRTAFRLQGVASGIERTNFFGYGNETAKPDRKSRYRTLESFLDLTPSFRFERSRNLQVAAGATLRVSDTPGDRPNVLNQVDAYGRGRFGEAGLRAGVHYDSRGLGEGLLSGGLFETVGAGQASPADLRIEAEASWFPAWLDVTDTFGAVEAEVAGYLGRSRSPVQLAARVGGRRVWGTYPWFESAFVGGRASLRGYSRQRFAGDASLYAGLEGRAWLVTMGVPVPLRVGVLGFADVARIWLSGESSDVWHPSWGGGVMLQPVATPFVLTAAVADGREGSRWYFGYGFFF